MPLAVAIASIEAASDTSKSAVHVLHDGIPADVQRKVEASANERFSIDWIAIDPRALDRDGDGLAPAALHPLPAPDAYRAPRRPAAGRLPRLRSRRPPRSRSPLGVPRWTEIPAQRSVTRASPSSARPTVRPGGRSASIPTRRTSTPGCCSWTWIGWRDEGSRCPQTLEALRSHTIGAGRRPGGTQHCPRRALDPPVTDVEPPRFALHRPQQPRLGRRADRRARRRLRDPAIVHFSGLSKPWNPRCVHPYRDDWFTVLQQTAWAGWPPPRAIPSERRAGRRARGDARRAGSLRDAWARDFLRGITPPYVASAARRARLRDRQRRRRAGSTWARPGWTSGDDGWNARDGRRALRAEAGRVPRGRSRHPTASASPPRPSSAAPRPSTTRTSRSAMRTRWRAPRPAGSQSRSSIGAAGSASWRSSSAELFPDLEVEFHVKEVPIDRARRPGARRQRDVLGRRLLSRPQLRPRVGVLRRCSTRPTGVPISLVSAAPLRSWC